MDCPDSMNGRRCVRPAAHLGVHSNGVDTAWFNDARFRDLSMPDTGTTIPTREPDHAWTSPGSERDPA